MFNFLTPSPPKKELLLEEAKKYLDQIKEKGKVPTITSDVFLAKDEIAILESPRTKLSETRAVRKSSGGFGGVRVAKGVSLGGYSGSSQSKQQWTDLDQGILTVTNKRIIFAGNKTTRDLKISKLVSANITPIPFFGTQLEMNVSSRKKGMRFNLGKDENHHIWSLIFQLLKQGADLKNMTDVEFDIEN